MKNTKRPLTILLALLLAQTLLPVTALAAKLPDNPKGTTLQEIPAGDTMDNNFGLVVVNNGTVANNHRDARIETNNGTVMDNHQSAHIETNNGTVEVNHGTVKYNRDFVQHNESTVAHNYGMVEQNNNEIEFNYGTVKSGLGRIVNDLYHVAVTGKGWSVQGHLMENNEYYIHRNNGIWRLTPKDGFVFKSAPTATNATVEKVSDTEYLLKNATSNVALTIDARPVIVITANSYDATFTFGHVGGENLGVTGFAGDGDVSYQWYTCEDRAKKNARPIPGETNRIYSLPADLARGQYYYFCRMSAPDADDADTDVALITVSPLIANPDDCKIIGITSGQEFTVGDIISFEAVGAGLDNAAPGEGDTCHVPLSWSMNPSGSWTKAPYAASVNTAQLAPGAHTLTVTFSEQSYQNGRWTNTGSTTTKSVGITLKAVPVPSVRPTASPMPSVRPGAVPKTGDDSRTGLWLALMGIACAGIAAMLVYRRGNKKTNEK